MTRRIFAVATIAAALTLAPAAAFAYEADDYAPSVTIVNNGVLVLVNGPVGNPTITVTVTYAGDNDNAVTIAGTKSLTKATDVNGDAEFRVAATEAGNYTVVATDADGVTLLTQAFTASATGGTTTAPSGTTTTTTTGGNALAVTGSSVLPLALGAGALAAAGVGAVVVANKRREGSQS